MPTAIPSEGLATTLRHDYEELWGTPERPMGGIGKRSVIQCSAASIRFFKLFSTMIHELLCPLYSSLAAWYGLDLRSMLLEEDPPAAQRMLDRLRDHGWMLDMVTKALEDRDAWPADDCAQLNPVDERWEPPSRKRKSDWELDNSLPAYDRSPDARI
ncbi:hypothetical protein IW262DRAFT_1459792 [Armillaria fumosa]|nr:hypothetical protein IW262DRAFT_1459792 [Armillaria fumosa]